MGIVFISASYHAGTWSTIGLLWARFQVTNSGGSEKMKIRRLDQYTTHTQYQSKVGTRVLIGFNENTCLLTGAVRGFRPLSRSVPHDPFWGLIGLCDDLIQSSNL